MDRGNTTMVDINVTRLPTAAYCAKLEAELSAAQARVAVLERENASLRQFKSALFSLSEAAQTGELRREYANAAMHVHAVRALESLRVLPS
jgi:hypothetical protein